MTRELSPKAGAELLKKSFAEKGVRITHTQALDLVAKMKGFEAWSHLQKATKAQTPKTDRKSKLPRRSEGSTLEQVLREYYGNWGEAPRFSKADWSYQVENGDTTLGYWGWVASEMVVHEVWLGPDGFESLKPIEVTLPNGQKSHWAIEANLTDRSGDLNYFAEEKTPSLALLELDEELRTSLDAQMWDEITFVARKDGKFGVLFEVEYASQESEAEYEDSAELKYKPHEEVVARLLRGLGKLQESFDVAMCVPDPGVIIMDRPAVWAFVPLEKPLTEQQREELGKALFEL